MANTAVNSTATQSSGDAASHHPFRRAQRLRALVLVVLALVIAFTGVLHSNLEFDRWVLVAGFAAIGLATGYEYSVTRSESSSGLLLLSTAASLLAAGALSVPLIVSDSTTVALVLTAWALVSVLITVIRGVRGVVSVRVAVPSAVLSAVLAFALMLVHIDIIAVVGFFGAYAIIHGVFLGIHAFDRESSQQPDAESAVQGTTQLTQEGAV